MLETPADFHEAMREFAREDGADDAVAFFEGRPHNTEGVLLLAVKRVQHLGFDPIHPTAQPFLQSYLGVFTEAFNETVQTLTEEASSPVSALAEELTPSTLKEFLKELAN